MFHILTLWIGPIVAEISTLENSGLFGWDSENINFPVFKHLYGNISATKYQQSSKKQNIENFLSFSKIFFSKVGKHVHLFKKMKNCDYFEKSYIKMAITWKRCTLSKFHWSTFWLQIQFYIEKWNWKFFATKISIFWKTQYWFKNS